MSNNDDCPIIFDDSIQLLDKVTICNYEDKNFVRSTLISPDGFQLLVTKENAEIESFTINPEIIDSHRFYKSKVTDDAAGLKTSSDPAFTSALQPKIHIDTGESVFDIKWYPLMNQTEAVTNCFATSCRDHPIHLWDSDTGLIRCSYSGYDHYDELDPAYSIAFNLAGDKIYAGTNRMIR